MRFLLDQSARVDACEADEELRFAECDGVMKNFLSHLPGHGAGDRPILEALDVRGE